MGSITQGLTQLGRGLGKRFGTSDEERSARIKEKIREEREQKERDRQGIETIALAEEGFFQESGLDLDTVKRLVKKGVTDADRLSTIGLNQKINALENQRADAETLREFKSQSEEAAASGMSLARPESVKAALRRQFQDTSLEQIPQVQPGTADELARLRERREFRDEISTRIRKEKRQESKEEKEFALRERQVEADLASKALQDKASELALLQAKEDINVLGGDALTEGAALIEQQQEKQPGVRFGSEPSKVSVLESFATLGVNPLITQAFFGRGETSQEDLVFASELSKLLRTRGKRDFTKLSQGRKVTEAQLNLLMAAKNLSRKEALKMLGITSTTKTPRFKIGL